MAEYYPTALEAFEDWGAVSAWMFLQRFPTRQLLEKAGKRQWEKFLHSRRLWRTGTPASIDNPTCSWEPNLDRGTSPVLLYTGTGNSEQNRYLQLINSPDATSASGLKAVGVRQT